MVKVVDPVVNHLTRCNQVAFPPAARSGDQRRRRPEDRPQEKSAMLALTRRVGEEVVIGDPSEPLGLIRVVEIHGDKVRLSFDFPKKVKINRKELAEQKARRRDQVTPEPPTENHNS